MNDLVIGAGPAGLQIGCAGRDYQILATGASPGTFFRTFPRHRPFFGGELLGAVPTALAGRKRA